MWLLVDLLGWSAYLLFSKRGVELDQSLACRARKLDVIRSFAVEKLFKVRARLMLSMREGFLYINWEMHPLVDLI